MIPGTVLGPVRVQDHIKSILPGSVKGVVIRKRTIGAAGVQTLFTLLHKSLGVGVEQSIQDICRLPGIPRTNEVGQLKETTPAQAAAVAAH